MRYTPRSCRRCNDAPVAGPRAAQADASKTNPTWQSMSLGIQPKLTVSSPQDPAEQEADRVADRVVSGGTADMQMSGVTSPAVARACATCEEEEKEDVVQAKEGAGGAAAGSGAQSAVAATQGGGVPLPSETRGYFEPRFGRDFSGVRIHTGGQAAGAARDINARAYTYGNDIVFGSGEYSPDTPAGRKLLAHELTHVVQQDGEHGSDGVVARAGFWEKWDAVWGVGPIDAMRASTIADEALAAAQATGMPGLRNGAADAWRHCFWNCNMTRALGYDQAETIATNHEEHGGGPANENQMDLFNNDVGRNCGGDNCDTCCQTALDAGRLRVIDGAGSVVPSTATPRGSGAQGGTTYDPSGYSRLPPAQRPPPPRREPIERCFTGAMPVTLFDGSSKPIEKIVVGDRVLAYDEATQQIRACEVLECHRHLPAHYREVFLQDGRRLEVTANHEVYVGDAWMEAGKLLPGSVLFSGDRERRDAGLVSTAVERVERAARDAPLFDITVAECHNYFVNGVLVHNKNV